MTASEPTVLMERDGHVAIVTLNRPERLNALNGQIHDEFEATLGQLNNDADVRCVVITGSGRAFCAGADMKELAPLFEDRDWEDSPEHHRQALRQ
ncbi:MAG TPA: enoyl-CoA hydratase/isomerase family protein, partial [Dehalococcoidia bacterium]|nr:enoyl-CoA hydratase/isomerase family protein [Dehalococcoidia bacterium]